MCCSKSYLPAAGRRIYVAAALAMSMLLAAAPAHASILTFDIIDPDSGREENYPERIAIDQTYGDRITSSSVTSGTKTFNYGLAPGEATPNVEVHYGPYSLFTGGPELWRYDYGDLDRVLYQGSRPAAIGYNYDVLDVVLAADQGYEVELHSFDLGGWFRTDYSINAVKIYKGVPFPFLTPTNDIFSASNVTVAGVGSTHVDFATPLTAQTIWIRIDASNLGDLSENIGIDNIYFTQKKSDSNAPALSPADIERAFMSAEVPEVASAAVWLVGALCVGLSGTRRQRSA